MKLVMFGICDSSDVAQDESKSNFDFPYAEVNKYVMSSSNVFG